jgi:Protein of unknown function (DUF3558)
MPDTVKQYLGGRVRLAVLALGLVTSVVVAACSGAAATQAPTPSQTTIAEAATATEIPLVTDAPLPDPCTLLTQDEADTLAGEKLDPPLPEGVPPTNCVWPTPTTGSVAQVEVGVGDGAKKFLDIDKDTLGHTFTQVSGLGDEAWQESGTIFVRTGTLWFSLHLVKLDSDPNDDSNTAALARTILGRIGG